MNRRGSILIMVILVLFLLTSLGISYVALTRGDRQRAADAANDTRAFENAQAGIREVLARMSVPGGALYIGQAPGSYTPGWGRYLVSAPGNSTLDPQYAATATDSLDNDGDGRIDEAGEHYPETGSRQIGLAEADRVDYPWVKVRYKLDAANHVILFGDHDNDPSTPPCENLAQGVPKIIVTAMGRSGASVNVVTVEAVKWPLQPAPGAVYTEGAMAFRGGSFQIDGEDHDAAPPYGPIPEPAPLPGIATPNDPGALKAGLVGQQQRCVRGIGISPSVGSSSVNLDLQGMVDAWSQIADTTLAGDSRDPDMGSWGSEGSLKIVHVKGNLVLSGTGSGAGVLLVDGNLDMGGQTRWSGLILCLKDAKIHGGNGGPKIVGSILIQGTLNGQSEVAGEAKVIYSSAMLGRLEALTGYEVSSWIDQ